MRLDFPHPRFPCDHARVWPATDIPAATRTAGTYVFDCAVCSTRHYLFLHDLFHKLSAMWDDESHPIRLATPDAAVKGRRLRAYGPPKPQPGRAVAAHVSAVPVRSVKAKGSGGLVVVATRAAKTGDAEWEAWARGRLGLRAIRVA